MIQKSMILFLFCIASTHFFGIGSTPKDELQHYYKLACTTQSDIYEHVPVLRSLAKECSSVVEMGLRTMVSSWGILKGLSESQSSSRSYFGIDIDHPPLDLFSLAKQLAEDNGISFDFCQANNRDVDIEQTDMLFIDTYHIYLQLTYELEKFSPKVSQYIAMHDTGATDTYEEPNEGNYDLYPPEYDRTKKGMWQAVLDFLERHPEWTLYERRLNNYGLTILKRTN